MRRLEIATSLVMLGFAAFVIYATSGFVYWSRLVPGPGFTPFWISLTGAGLAVALLVIALRGPDRDVDLPDKRSFVKIAVVYATMWVIVLAASLTGFLAAAVLFMLFALIVVFRNPVLPSLATTVVIAALVHFLFNQWLDVRLPTGVLGF